MQVSIYSVFVSVPPTLPPTRTFSPSSFPSHTYTHTTRTELPTSTYLSIQEPQSVVGGSKKFVVYQIHIQVKRSLLVRVNSNPYTGGVESVDIVEHTGRGRGVSELPAPNAASASDFSATRGRAVTTQQQRQQPIDEECEDTYDPDDETFTGMPADVVPPVADVQERQSKFVASVGKRYSQFRTFHQQWSKKYPQHSSSFSLPGRRLFNNFSRSVIEDRKIGLSKYMNGMKHIPVLAHELFRFLGVYEQVVQALPSIDKLDAMMLRASPSDASYAAKSDGKGGHERKGSVVSNKELARRIDPTAKAKYNPMQEARRNTVKLKAERIKQLQQQESVQDAVGGDAAGGDTDDMSDFVFTLRRPVDHDRELLLPQSPPGDHFWDAMTMLRCICDGDVDGVVALLENGVDVNCAIGYTAQTPLAWAVAKDQVEVADLLTNCGGTLQPQYVSTFPNPPVAAHIGVRSYKLN
jgi:PX domain